MTISSVARKATAIVVAMAAMGAVSTAYAQNSIFPTGWDNKVRDRLFMRLGYTASFIKTKADDARDLTGPVVTKQELLDAFTTGNAISVACGAAGDPDTPDCNKYDAYDYDGTANSYLYTNATGPVLTSALNAYGLNGIGTPPGIKAKAQKVVGTPTISLGYWLDDERKWLLEAYVLAAPLKVKIYGDGVRDDGSPNSINGKHLATVKLLPPMVVASYNFGDKSSFIRPYVGAGAMYAIFFDQRTTSFFDDYQGGKTSMSTKNTFGFGPFVGLQSPVTDDWHINVSVGQIKLKTTTTLITSNTQVGNGSLVLTDLQSQLRNAISDGDTFWAQTVQGGPLEGSRDNKFTNVVMDLVKRNTGKTDFGTFKREQRMTMTNTIVTLSVGRSF